MSKAYRRQGYLLTQEGWPCRSRFEAMVDAYFHWRAIPHRHEVRVPRTSRIADFKVGKYFVEVAGMMKYRKYQIKLDQKMGEYGRLRVPVIYLFEHDVIRLFTGCPIGLRYRKGRACKKCQKATHDLVNEMCRPCNRKEWGKANALEGFAHQLACAQVFVFLHNNSFRVLSYRPQPS